MRADVRSKHQDIRLNSKVNKSMFEFMAKKVKASELKSDMQGDKPATSKGRLQQTSTAVKRKRKVESDEESTESESRPSKSAPSRSNRVSSSKHSQFLERVDFILISVQLPKSLSQRPQPGECHFRSLEVFDFHPGWTF